MQGPWACRAASLSPGPSCCPACKPYNPRSPTAEGANSFISPSFPSASPPLFSPGILTLCPLPFFVFRELQLEVAYLAYG